MRAEPTIDDLRKRLHAKEARVRRIAVADLLRLKTPDALSLALEHLNKEPDESIARRIIEAIGAHAFAPAAAKLRQIRDDPHTEAATAHAALIACDRIERSTTQDDPSDGAAPSNAPGGP